MASSPAAKFFRGKLRKAGIDVRAWVRKVDNDGDGTISAAEFQTGLQQAGFKCTVADVRKLFAARVIPQSIRNLADVRTDRQTGVRCNSS